MHIQTESYRVFEQALTGAKEVAADKKATKDEVENALKSSDKCKSRIRKESNNKTSNSKETNSREEVVVAKASAKLKAGKKK
mgnify:CR=1 FL=1